MTVYDKLEELDIYYEEIEHDAVYTIGDANYLKNRIDGIGCKSLFLTDRHGNYFLYVLKDSKKADLKELSTLLKIPRISFSSEEELKNLLGASRGNVSPLGIINDQNKQVKIILDKELVTNKILVHPNVNTKTISIYCKDLIKYIENLNHVYFIL